MLKVLNFPLDAQWENILCFFRIGSLLAKFVLFFPTEARISITNENKVVLDIVSLHIVKISDHNNNIFFISILFLAFCNFHNNKILSH